MPTPILKPGLNKFSGAGAIAEPVRSGYRKPKVAMFYYAPSTTFDNTVGDRLKLADIVVLNQTKYLGTTVATNIATQMVRMRSANPNIKILCYVNAAEATAGDAGGGLGYTNGLYSADFSGEGITMTPPFLKAWQEGWFVRTVAGDYWRSFPVNGSVLWRGTWESGTSGVTSYPTGCLVTFGGLPYMCKSTHTRDATWAADYPSEATSTKWTTNITNLDVNFTAANGADVNGETWVQRQARWEYALASRGGCVWDGCYIDASSYYGNAVADWDKNGSDTYVQTDASTRRQMEAGQKAFLVALRQQFGANAVLIGNSHNGDLGLEQLTSTDLTGEYDGNLFESAVAPWVSFSNISIDGLATTGGPNNVFRTWPYKNTYAKVPARSRSILGVKQTLTNDYKTLRCGVAAALMQDGYVFVTGGSLDSDYAKSPPNYYDEYNALLGEPIDPPQIVPFSSTIWRRRFQNGIVLMNSSVVNPSAVTVWSSASVSYALGDYVSYNGAPGNRGYCCRAAHTSTAATPDTLPNLWLPRSSPASPGNRTAGAAVTITNTIMGAPYNTYKRLTGTQDAAVNSGATVSGSFSLDGWDGLILLCVVPGVHS
jgi:hypothetical protein